MGQPVHIAAPVASWYWPVAQLAQLDAAEAACDWPTEQLVQPEAPAAEYFPAKQFVQLDDMETPATAE